MRHVFLARHGETEWNACGRLQGHTDVPLNDAGRAQAKELATRLANARVRLASVTTSDLSRAKETGAIVARAFAIAEPAVDADLRERRFGIFEGLTREEIAASHADAWRAWQEKMVPPPGGEIVEDAIARIARALASAFERAAEGPVLVVSHGGIMRLWLSATTGVPVGPIANGTVFLLERDGERVHASEWEP